MPPPNQPQKNAYKRPFIRLLAAQAVAGALVVLIEVAAGSWLVPGAGIGLEVWVLVATQAVLASIITMLLGLSRGWGLVQFILPWATWGALYLDIPSWAYLVCFILTYALYKNVGAERVPLYLSNQTTWLALEELLEDVDLRDNTFIDLGSGLGGTVTYLGGKYPKWKFEGIESAPLVFIISWLRILISGQGIGKGNVSVHFGDMWGVDLSKYNMVYAFLSPVPMARLLEKVKNEMHPGSFFVSNSFWADGVEFDERIELADGRKTKLYVKKI